MTKDEILEQARAMIRAEGAAITTVAAQLDDSFVETVNLVSDCSGCIYITGAGTSGTIARRTAHLLATCSVRAFYINAAEALHGPSAAVSAGDIIIILSKAGESAELNQFAAVAKERGAKIIAWTRDPGSPLGRLSDVVVRIHPDPAGEGDGVLPFGSSLALGAVSDALTLMVNRRRAFDLATLAQTHPAGATAKLVMK